MTETNRGGRLRRGLALIESAMVLLILGLVTGGIVYGADRLYTTSKNATVIEDVNAISLALRDMYTASADYSTLGPAAYDKVLPNRYKTGSGYRSPYGGNLGLGPASGYPGYSLYFSDVTSDTCIALARGSYSRRIVALGFGDVSHSLVDATVLDRATIERDCRRFPRTNFYWQGR